MGKGKHGKAVDGKDGTAGRRKGAGKPGKAWQRQRLARQGVGVWLARALKVTLAHWLSGLGWRWRLAKPTSRRGA